MDILSENDRGYLGFDGNELVVGSKIDDPPKVRLTSPTTEHGGGGGVLSANISRHAGVVCDGHQQIEIGFIRFEQSEAVRGDPSNPRGEYNLLLNVGGEDDSAMQRGLALEADRVTKMNPALGGLFGNSGNPPSRFVSPNGRYWLQMQDDGNFVIYDVSNPTKPKAIFDLWSLQATLAALMRR
jgi:hypothetical protein